MKDGTRKRNEVERNAPPFGGGQAKRGSGGRIWRCRRRRRGGGSRRRTSFRSVEQADACRTPGEIGELLRREGLYSSHLSSWRKAAREGVAAGAGEEARDRGPRTGSVRRGRCGSWSGRTRGCARKLRKARIIIDVQGKVAGLLGVSPGDGKALLSAAGGLAGHVGVRAACEALGVRARHVLPSPEAEDRAAAVPAGSRPGPGRGGAGGGLRCGCGSPRFADRAPAEVYATLLDEGVHLCSERTMYRILAENRAVRERRAQRSHPNHPKPEVVARAPNEVWSWGHHAAPRAGEVAVLPSLRDPGHLQPLCHGLDGGGARDRRPGRTLGWRDVSQARRAAPGAHAALGSRLSHDGQVHGAAAGRPGRHASRWAAPGSRTTTRTRRRTSRPSSTTRASPAASAASREAKDFCREFFQWYNTEHRHGGIGPAHPRAGPPRPRPRGDRAPPERAGRGLRRPARPLRGWPAEGRGTTGGGLDQPARSPSRRPMEQSRPTGERRVH